MNLKNEIQNESNSIRINNDNNIVKRAEYVFDKTFNSLKDLWQLQTEFPDGSIIKSDFHLFGKEEDQVNLISYDNEDGIYNNDLIKEMKNRRVAISIKHHVPKPLTDNIERMKLQATHMQLVIRSENNVFTLNNPQSYEDGLFGNENYPMTFMKLKYPKSLNEEQISQYEDNIVTWAAICNTYTKFPQDYNGGDELSIMNKDSLYTYGNQLLKALVGDGDALRWLTKPENHLYCAEYGVMALSLGINFPLNESYVSSALLDSVKKEIKKRNFLIHNANPNIDCLNLITPSNELKSFYDLGYVSKDSFFDGALAIKPFLISDMIMAFIKYSVPRGEQGEDLGKYQVMLLEQSKNYISKFLPQEALDSNVSNIPILLDEIKKVLADIHSSYDEFNSFLSPYLEKLNDEVKKYSSSSNVFMPPHAYLVRLHEELEAPREDILKLDYLGHGLHSSIVKGVF